jgi:hypothetical protein
MVMGTQKRQQNSLKKMATNLQHTNGSFSLVVEHFTRNEKVDGSIPSMSIIKRFFLYHCCYYYETEEGCTDTVPFPFSPLSLCLSLI